MPVSPIALARPVAGDYDPAAAAYVALVPDVADAGAELTAQREAVRLRFSTMTGAQAGHRYAEGKWSVREILGHLGDAERVFAYRMLRIARGDGTPLAGFDENTYVPAGAFESRALSDVLDEWTSVRNATIALALGLPREAWARRGTANGKAVTPSALLYITLGHVEHHLRVLRDRYRV